MEQKDEDYKNGFSKIKLTFAYKHIHDTFQGRKLSCFVLLRLQVEK